MRYLVRCFPLCLALLFVGCESVSTRARRHGEMFAQLGSATQQRLLTGDVALGDNPLMVEIALGKPDHDQAMLTTSGRVRRTWVYTKKQYMKEGSQISRVDEVRNTAEVADVYRVFQVITHEVTFLDDEVIRVRDPQHDTAALAVVP